VRNGHKARFLKNSQSDMMCRHLGPMLRFLKNQDWRVVLTLVISTMVIGGAIYFRRIVYPTDNDYSTHVLYTQQMLDKKYEDVPDINLGHPGLQLLLAGIHLLTFKKLGLYGSLIVVQTLTQALTALILYFFWFEGDEGRGNNWIRAFWSATLTIVAPVMLLAFMDKKYYFGYIGLANYHNPTIHLLRPFALLSFILAARAVRQAHSTKLLVLVSSLLIVLSALIKPSYAVIILPGLGLVTLLRLYKKEPLDWTMLILGFALPAGLVLLAQWIFTYILESGGGAIGFHPFEVESAFSDYLFLKFLLSALFPLSVLFIRYRDFMREPELQLAWFTFIIGAAQLYLLAEEGDRFYHGNFRWGAQISLFLLFAVSVRQILRLESITGLMRRSDKLIFYGTYLAHLAAGVAYYIHVFISPGYG
jgi:hypothetical protein